MSCYCTLNMQNKSSVGWASLQKISFIFSFFNVIRLLTEGVKTEEMGLPIWGSKFTLEFIGRLIKLTEIASINSWLRSTSDKL